MSNKVNELLVKIVYDSEIVADIMSELLVELPEFFRTTSFHSVKVTVTEFVCNYQDKNYTTQAGRKFENIIRKHLGVPNPKTKSEQVKVAINLRTKLNNTINNISRDDNFMHLLGCDRHELIEHLESQFTEGMTWENYGLTGWHIDHIRPLCSFDLTNVEEIEKATNFLNLRPLWAEENIKKAQQDRKLSIRKKSK